METERTILDTPKPKQILRNGAMVLGAYDIPKQSGWAEASIVLCWLEDNTVTPYVTWVFNRQDGSCSWGHYDKDFLEAVQDFGERVLQYYRKERDHATG